MSVAPATPRESSGTSACRRASRSRRPQATACDRGDAAPAEQRRAKKTVVPVSDIDEDRREGGRDQQCFTSRQNRAQHRKVRGETRNQPHRDKQDEAVAACARRRRPAASPKGAPEDALPEMSHFAAEIYQCCADVSGCPLAFPKACTERGKLCTEAGKVPCDAAYCPLGCNHSFHEESWISAVHDACPRELPTGTAN